MPFVSTAQQRFMHSKHPTIAKRWDKETDFSNLPEHKKPEKKSWIRAAAEKRK